jgi:hypothetical protein
LLSSSSPAKAAAVVVVAKYRAYSTGKYNQRMERYDYCDIFELSVLRVPLDIEKVNYYREHPKETPLTPAWEDGRIIGLSREGHYVDQQGADHIVVPLQMRVRRFYNATNEDLELWEMETKEEETTEEEVIAFMGSIPGIAPVREILINSGEAGLCHEATSDRDEEIRKMINSDGLLDLDTRTDPFFHNYEEHFTPHQPCSRWDCPLCYGSLQIFDKPKLFLLGYPENAPEVIKLRIKKANLKKLEHLWKLAKLSQISLMSLEVMDSMDAVDSPHYYDQLQ